MTHANPQLGYVFQTSILSKKNIDDFVFPENRRRLSQNQVESLAALLGAGKHFDSPLVVNRVGRQLRLLDGNHRVEAIKRVIKRRPDFRVPILLIVYEALDEDGEIQIFRRWNVGRAQTLDDFIQSIATKVLFIRLVKKDFPVPVRVYKDAGSISVKQLCYSILASKEADPTVHWHREKFIESVKGLTEEDYEQARKIWGGLVDLFDLPEFGNGYYKGSFMHCAYFIADWYKHEKDVWKKIKQHIMYDEEIEEISKFRGREVMTKLVQLMHEKIKLPLSLNMEEPKRIISRQEAADDEEKEAEQVACIYGCGRNAEPGKDECVKCHAGVARRSSS